MKEFSILLKGEGFNRCGFSFVYVTSVSKTHFTSYHLFPLNSSVSCQHNYQNRKPELLCVTTSHLLDLAHSQFSRCSGSPDDLHTNHDCTKREVGVWVQLLNKIVQCFFRPSEPSESHRWVSWDCGLLASPKTSVYPDTEVWFKSFTASVFFSSLRGLILPLHQEILQQTSLTSEQCFTFALQLLAGLVLNTEVCRQILKTRVRAFNEFLWLLIWKPKVWQLIGPAYVHNCDLGCDVIYLEWWRELMMFNLSLFLGSKFISLWKDGKIQKHQDNAIMKLSAREKGRGILLHSCME